MYFVSYESCGRGGPPECIYEYFRIRIDNPGRIDEMNCVEDDLFERCRCSKGVVWTPMGSPHHISYYYCKYVEYRVINYTIHQGTHEYTRLPPLKIRLKKQLLSYMTIDPIDDVQARL